MMWEYNGYWNKSKLYVDRALREDRNGAMFAFWMALALEHLGRASLAKIHPALLADPQDGYNILFAFGYGNTKTPKTIGAKTVFDRCRTIIEGFTEDDVKTSQVIIGRRNEELHTGAPTFEDLPNSLWLTQFYKCCSVLLSHQGKTLADLFGADKARAADDMINAAAENVKADVERTIGLAKAKFDKLTTADKELAKDQAKSYNIITLASKSSAAKKDCPACGGKGIISGKEIRTVDPRLDEDQIILETVFLPEEFTCNICNLHLTGHGHLHYAGLGGQYNKTTVEDAMTYYASQLDPADFYEPDYGND